MLSKKITVQKSFRIEANMENDLELLSQKLNRPQNELVNAALNQLLIDNMEWFVRDFFEKKKSELNIEITGFRIHLKDDGEKFINYDYDIETPSFTEHCKNGFLVNSDIGYEVLKNELKKAALKIGADTPEIQEYLHNRFNYVFARESIIQRFDKEKFIKQSVGLEDEDESFRAINEFVIPAKTDK